MNTPDWVTTLKQLAGHYGVLLVALMLMLLMYPFAGGSDWVLLLYEAALVLAAGTLIVRCWRRRIAPAIIFVVVATELLSWLFRSELSPVEGLPTPALRIVFLLLVMWIVLSDVVRSRRVTMDTVFGACCAYLLMGVVWGKLYLVLEYFEPGSFVGAKPLGVGSALEVSLDYYSFITLTTVGYGDLTPATEKSRTLAMLEGLTGQLYIAILVARLVAMELTGRQDDAKPAR